MTPQARRAARELAVRALTRYRDGEYTGPSLRMPIGGDG
jgi:hypothetical protein